MGEEKEGSLVEVLVPVSRDAVGLAEWMLWCDLDGARKASSEPSREQ